MERRKRKRKGGFRREEEVDEKAEEREGQRTEVKEGREETATVDGERMKKPRKEGKSLVPITPT